MLLLHLDLDYIAWMLNDFGYEGLVSSTNFSCNPLQQVNKAAVHPVLPEDTGPGTKRCSVSLDHAKCSMHRPENEEDDKQVMRVPEALEVLSLDLLDRCRSYEHQGCEHHIARPARTSQNVCKQPSFEAEVVLCRELGEIVPVSNCMYPAPKDNRPGH